MQRLQGAALALSAKNGESTKSGAVPFLPTRQKESEAVLKDFSLQDSADFLAISKSRGQLSLDSSPASGERQ